MQLQSLETIPETAVWGESRWGTGVWGSNESHSRLEEILGIIGSGSFPAKREELTAGQRRQLRDAMIVEARIRAGRDIFVTNDARVLSVKNDEPILKGRSTSGL